MEMINKIIMLWEDSTLIVIDFIQNWINTIIQKTKII